MTRRLADEGARARERSGRAGRNRLVLCRSDTGPEWSASPSEGANRVLVAESNTLLLADLVEILHGAGARVAAVTTSADDLEQMADRLKPDAVVLDYDLAHADIASVADRLETAGMRLLVTTTGFRDDPPRQSDRRVTLIKPYSQALVVHALRRLGICR